MSKASSKPPALPAIKVADLHKSYWLGKTRLHVLRGLSFDIRKGEFVAVVGASGSGKSTLLHLIGLLDALDSGQVFLSGTDIAEIPARQRDRLRCREIGFVFQFYHLLPELNVLENALLPAKVDVPVFRWLARRQERRRQAEDILGRLGLKDRLKHRPKELSGGERQRVAIARALMNSPHILLADEPTGNLDSKTGKTILNVLRSFNRQGQTILMVTHDSAIAAEADRVLHLKDGRLAKDDRSGSSQPPEVPSQTAPGAVASVVCGIIGLVFAGMILGIVAIVCAATARRFLRRNPSVFVGRKKAWAGIVLGILDLTGGTIVFFWWLLLLTGS